MNYELTKGDDHSFNFQFQDANGDAVDITGYSLSLILKVYEDDDESDAVLSKTVSVHGSPSTGQTSIALTDDDTDLEGTYFYLLRYVDSSGYITTIATGVITFDRSSHNPTTSLSVNVDAATTDETTGGMLREVQVKETFDGDGSTTSFTLTYAPKDNSVQVIFNGQTLFEGESADYTVSGAIIVGNFTAETGDKIGVTYVKN
jgi:hypothetical protein